MTKVCSKCGIEKELTEFYKDVTRKGGLEYKCKECKKEYQKDNIEQINTYQKEYRKINAEKIATKQKEYCKVNSEHVANVQREYYKKNKKNIYEKQKEYQINFQKEYQKQRRLVDPLFKLRCSIRNCIISSFRKNGFSKNSKTAAILGCSFEEFQLHIEKQFTEGMSWANQGLWHLDHIYPVSLAADEQHLLQLNHYTNFQPLWAEDNLKKGNKII